MRRSGGRYAAPPAANHSPVWGAPARTGADGAAGLTVAPNGASFPAPSCGGGDPCLPSIIETWTVLFTGPDWVPRATHGAQTGGRGGERSGGGGDPPAWPPPLRLTAPTAASLVGRIQAVADAWAVNPDGATREESKWGRGGVGSGSADRQPGVARGLQIRPQPQRQCQWPASRSREAAAGGVGCAKASETGARARARRRDNVIGARGALPRAAGRRAAGHAPPRSSSGRRAPPPGAAGRRGAGHATRRGSSRTRACPPHGWPTARLRATPPAAIAEGRGRADQRASPRGWRAAPAAAARRLCKRRWTRQPNRPPNRTACSATGKQMPICWPLCSGNRPRTERQSVRRRC